MIRALCTSVVCAAILLAWAPAVGQTDGSGGEPSEEAGGAEQAGQAEEMSFETLIRRAGAAYEAERYDEAIGLFERAYAKKDVPNLLYNIGRSHERLGEFEAAIEHYENFVNEPNVDIEARRDALERLKTLREIVAMREDQATGKEGAGEGEAIPEAPNADKREELADPTAGADPQPADPTTEPVWTYGWVFSSVGVAALGTGGAFAFLARSDHQTFLDAKTRSAARQAAERGRRRAIVADSLLIGGGAVAAAGLAMFIWPPRREVATERARLRVFPRLGARGAGLSISAEF